MRSIFWIGCILVVLVSLLSSGAIAESVNISTVEATVAQAENVTDGAVEAAANVTTALAENVTDMAKEAVTTVVVPGAENVTATAAVTETNETNVTTENPVAEPDLVNDTLVKFVTDARTYAMNHGKNAALITFNDQTGGFVNDKMYLFAYDYDGKVLALPYNPGMVGLNQISLTDSKGYRYVQQMRDTAKRGVGFVTYQEADMMNKGIVSEKVSYVTDVDGTYWIGAGVYKSKEVKPAAVIAAVKEIVSTVTDANATVSAENLTADVKTVADAAQTVTAKLTA